MDTVLTVYSVLMTHSLIVHRTHTHTHIMRQSFDSMRVQTD